MRILVRLKLAAFFVAMMFVLGAGAAPVFAAGEAPWWHVVASTAPANLPPGGVAKVLVSATNMGDGEANPSSTPIVVSDKLPPGIEAIGITSQAGPLGIYGHGECSLEAVSCTFRSFENSSGGGLPPYSDVEMALTVRVTAGAKTGGVNEAVVEGGGASRDTRSQPFTVDGAATGFGVEWFEMVPEAVGGVPDTQAGSHPFQLTTTLDLNQKLEAGEVESPTLVRDLRFHLPVGLVGNPNAVPQCTSREFAEINGLVNTCPPETIIGVAKVAIAFGATPLVIPVPLFNLVPDRGEPARFGFVAVQDPVILDTSVRTGGDYGVTVTVSNITEASDLLASQVTFWGNPFDPRHNSQRGWHCLLPAALIGQGPCEPFSTSSAQPLLTLPTSCTLPWSPTVSGDSWAEPAVQRSGEYALHDDFGHALGLSGCNGLTFEPSIEVAPDGTAGSTPTGLTVGIHVPQTAGLNPEGVAQATVKDTTVALPAGVALNPAAADGLASCSTEQLRLESAAPVGCPEASKVGTVEIHTPLLPDPLVGAAYLAAQNANPFGSLVALYVVAEDARAGVLVKLAGEVRLCESVGQIVDGVSCQAPGQIISTFKETPQLPFEDLSLHFFGGSRAPLGTPALCGSYRTVASIEPWSGTEAIGSSSEFQIVAGPNGSPCSNPLPFTPSLDALMTDPKAGEFSPLSTTITREDGQQALQSVQLHMPPGLSGLLSGVKLCGEAQANEGTCGPESEIGETTVSVGLGGDPFSVKGGRVYITGPYQGAPFGLSIVNPAKAGPFDLGKGVCDCVVVRAKIEVDPQTAALTITTDNSGPYKIPTILEGIPLQIKHVNVTVDREHFAFNPTNCSPLAVTGGITSTQGATAPVSEHFEVTNCAKLKFAPRFKVSTAGRTSRRRGASLDVKLAYPKAPFGSQANIKSVKVDLPKQLPSRLTTLQKACPDSTFNQNPASCPAASRVGTAVATTPLIPVSLSGPAYFVSHGGAKFPELVVVLSGYGVTVQLHGETFINKAGITSSTFRAIPDVPVGSFKLTLPEGLYSALAANGSLCTSTLRMPTAFTAQNGMTIRQSTPITVAGCPKQGKKAHKAHHKQKTR